MSVVIDRRALLAMAAAGAILAPSAACAVDPHVYEIDIRRNVGCNCCQAWADHLRRNVMFRVTIADEPEMDAHRQRLGVPDDLVSCHTGLVNGYVIEGHVPAEDVLRLLAERPRGVRGIAVPGMPIGSPGMESPSGRTEAYDVIAFHADGTRSVFAHHAAS
jgi:hypothetical protein